MEKQTFVPSNGLVLGALDSQSLHVPGFDAQDGSLSFNSFFLLCRPEYCLLCSQCCFTNCIYFTLSREFLHRDWLYMLNICQHNYESHHVLDLWNVLVCVHKDSYIMHI